MGESKPNRWHAVKKSLKVIENPFFPEVTEYK